MIRTRYIVFYADGARATSYVDWPEEPGLDRLKALIEPLLDGAPLERVNVFYAGEYRDMFVDELSALKDLPFNARATEIYRQNYITHNPNVVPSLLPAVWGTAVLFPDRKVWL